MVGAGPFRHGRRHLPGATRSWIHWRLHHCQRSPASSASRDENPARLRANGACDARKLYAFCLIECHSRKMYLEFTHSQTFETLVRCHIHAFEAMSGVARELWFDNMATVVSEHDGNLVRFHPRFLAFMGCTPLRVLWGVLPNGECVAASSSFSEQIRYS